MALGGRFRKRAGEFREGVRQLAKSLAQYPPDFH
jgi:hypothetical protein